MTTLLSAKRKEEYQGENSPSNYITSEVRRNHNDHNSRNSVKFSQGMSKSSEENNSLLKSNVNLNATKYACRSFQRSTIAALPSFKRSPPEILSVKSSGSKNLSDRTTESSNIFSAKAIPPLQDEVHNDILYDFYNEKVNSHYETLTRLSKEWQVIARNLKPAAWPILPMSHRITKQDGQWVIQRYRDVDFLELNLLTFGSDSKNKINYLVLENDRLIYSYAHTRNPAFGGGRTRFPFTIKTRDSQIINYMDGHSIDHADTLDEKLLYYGVSSTHHKKNHIPEPDRTYWGLTLRNQLVKEFRGSQDSYSQWVFYPDKPFQINSGAFVPLGVLFLRHGIEGNIKEGWSIPWKDPLHNTAGQGQKIRTTLQHYSLNHHSQQSSGKDILNSNNRFAPKCFVYVKESLDQKFAYALNVPDENNLNHPYSQFSLYRMEVLADQEVIPYWSIKLIDFNLDQQLAQDSKNFLKTLYWTNRTINYLEELQENDFQNHINIISLQNLMIKLKKSSLDTNCYFGDKLARIIKNAQDFVNIPRDIDSLHFNGQKALHFERTLILFKSVKRQINKGIGSLSSIVPLSPKEFQNPSSLELEIIDDCKTTVTKKLQALLSKSQNNFSTNQNIIKVWVTGNEISVDAKELLKSTFGAAKVEFTDTPPISSF